MHAVVLFHSPCLAGEYHVAECGEAFICAYCLDLLVDLIVVGEAFDVADDADSERELVTVHHCELLMEEVALGVGIVNEHVINGVSVLADLDSFEQESVAHQTFVLLLAEEHLLVMHEVDGAFGTVFTVGDEVVYAVVPYHAVAEHLDYRCALVLLGCCEDFLVDLKLHID